jgi:signal transduction histidine kinase
MAISSFEPSAKKESNIYFNNLERNILSMIHELSGPLTAARLNFDKYITDNNNHNLDLLNVNIKLMEDYLINTRSQISHQPLTDRHFSVNKQLNVIIANLIPIANQRQVKIELLDSEDYILKGNPTRFKQIISCFIRNAIDSYDNCDDRQKVIKIEKYPEDQYLVIEVKDYGCGINKSLQNKIFNPYFSTKNKSSGLGLGLSLAHQSLTNDFSGKIKLQSSESTGSLFYIYFLIS